MYVRLCGLVELEVRRRCFCSLSLRLFWALFVCFVCTMVHLNLGAFTICSLLPVKTNLWFKKSWFHTDA